MAVERFWLTPEYSISRVIKGGWHLAGGHGRIDKDEAVLDMRKFVEAGITTFDCADIYTGVEELIGQFLKVHGEQIKRGDLPEVQVHTKYVPDYDDLATLKEEDTIRIIDRSLQRIGVERLDLVQFAWWDYQFDRYVEVAHYLAKLQKEGKIRHIGITNFDAAHVHELAQAGITFVSNQVQYSILDQRVKHDQPALISKFNIPFLCYGVVAGGFLSEKYLGMAEPEEPLENRSLTKYKLIIEEFGDWDLFQELLMTMKGVAEKYNVGIGELACKYILQQQQVAGIIVGARNSNHLSGLIKLNSFSLVEDDINEIELVMSKAKGPKGPFYELERDKNDKHGSIMKYNLNKDK